MNNIIFQKEPIDILKVLDEIGSEEDGAVAVFIGRPRKDVAKREVKYIEYEIYKSMAEKELGKIIKNAFEKWPITDCIVMHRVGRVELKEPSILIAVSSSHREESFDAVKYIIDTIKITVPIWKTEYYADGDSQVFERS